MLADEKATETGAPTRDVTAVGAALAAEPRTESLDWVFVGYLPQFEGWRRSQSRKGVSSEAVWVEDESELARAAAVVLARDGSGGVHPYVFVRPGLLTALEDAFVPLALEAARSGYQGGAPQFSVDVWNVEVDFAAFQRSQDMEGPGWEAAERESLAVLKQAVGDGAWELCDEMACDRDRFPMRRGTMREIMEDSLRRELRARLHRPGAVAPAWQIVLTADRAGRPGRLTTTDGRELVAYTRPASNPRTATAPAEAQSLEDRAFAWVQANPGATGGQVVEGVGRQRKDVLDALKALERAGRIENRGNDRAKAWHVKNAPAF